MLGASPNWVARRTRTKAVSYCCVELIHTQDEYINIEIQCVFYGSEGYKIFKTLLRSTILSILQTLVGKLNTESDKSTFHISLLRTRVSDLRTKLHYFADVYQFETPARLTTMLAVSLITRLQAFR